MKLISATRIRSVLVLSTLLAVTCGPVACGKGTETDTDADTGTAGNAAGEQELSALKPFTSDGCSLFPDSSAITSHDWCACCLEHDEAYWRGGSAEQREAADQLLRDCVFDKTGNDALATVMYEGVRIGGSPYFYTWYRWGYGWSVDRNYQLLTAAETRLADKLLAEYRNSGSQSVCRVE